MSWRIIKGHRYYYQTTKIAGKVISKYVGTGLRANLAAELDKERRLKRETQNIAQTREFSEVLDTDQAEKELFGLVIGLVRIVLVANGYHNHRGQWRRSR